MAADDQVTNLAESTDVSLSLAGIDGDAASVSVEISDGTNTVNADATNDGSGWVVADQDLSGLADGALTVSATVTDQAGNSAPAVSASLTLDTSADLGDAFTVSVAADDQVTNLAESTDVSLSLAGIDSDAASVSVEISDGTNTVNADATNDGSGWVVADQDLSGLADGALTVSATVTDQAGNSADVSTTLELDTVVVPPVTLLVSDAHADMTAAEAANAMTVTVEDGSAWTVTLTGTRNDAAVTDQATKLSARDTAQGDKDTAQSTYDTLSGELSSLQTQLGLEQQGLAELNSTLHEATESGLQGDVPRHSSHTTRPPRSRAAFVTLAADPEPARRRRGRDRRVRGYRPHQRGRGRLRRPRHRAHTVAELASDSSRWRPRIRDRRGSRAPSRRGRHGRDRRVRGRRRPHQRGRSSDRRRSSGLDAADLDRWARARWRSRSHRPGLTRTAPASRAIPHAGRAEHRRGDTNMASTASRPTIP